MEQYSRRYAHNDYIEAKIRKNKIKRARQLFRIRCMIMVFSVFVAICLSLTFGSFLSNASEGHEVESIKCYKSIMVNYQESLDDIASIYADELHYSIEGFVNEVVSINHLSSQEVAPGQYIIIPYYAELAALN